MTTLFDPLTLGKYHLPNRIFMSPMTRGRAEAGAVPGRIVADYYAARADAGLLITKATAICPQGYGWFNAPGICTDAQEEGWKHVTDAVHARGEPKANRTDGRELIMLAVMIAILAGILAKFTMADSAPVFRP